jgi:hypothetical protein
LSVEPIGIEVSIVADRSQVGNRLDNPVVQVQMMITASCIL